MIDDNFTEDDYSPPLADGDSAWLVAAIDAAIRRYFVEGKDYGDLLTYAWLFEALGTPDPRKANATPEEYDRLRFQWMRIFGAFSKRLLVGHNIALANVIGQGYRVVMPREQARWAASVGFDEIGKAMSKMSARVKHVAIHRLTDEERTEHRRVADHVQTVKRWVAEKGAKPVKRWNYE